MSDITSEGSEELGEPRLSLPIILVAIWGVGGVLGLLAQAMIRLTPLALEPLEKQMLNSWQLALYIIWAIVNAYAEGYRGFQKAFSPRVVARAFHLGRHPRLVYVLLAPLYCMALFHAKRKNLILAWGLSSFILAAVVLVRLLPQPWRGIIDVGVVVGLAWGAISIVWIFVSALAGKVPTTDSLPDAG
jgi:hypothetical protein